MKKAAFVILLLLMANSQWIIANSLSILTWNTGRMGGFAKPDKNEVLQYLLQQEADVICLQEVDVYKDARYLTLPDVKQTLGKKYPYSYIDFSIYNKRHQYGTMVWSRYPLIHKQSIHYESHGNLSNRCDIVVGKDTFRLFNNHLESYKFTPDDLGGTDSLRTAIKRLGNKWARAVPLRNRQAQVVRKEIEASPYPVIVVGDFNSVALSYAYWCIGNGLYDAWRETHYPWQLGATCEKRGLGLRIDYILCSDPLRPAACDVRETAGSDHKPLMTTLKW